MKPTILLTMILCCSSFLPCTPAPTIDIIPPTISMKNEETVVKPDIWRRGIRIFDAMLWRKSWFGCWAKVEYISLSASRCFEVFCSLMNFSKHSCKFSSYRWLSSRQKSLKMTFNMHYTKTIWGIKKTQGSLQFKVNKRHSELLGCRYFLLSQ